MATLCTLPHALCDLSMGERPTKPFSRRKRNSPTEPCGRPRSENPSQSQISRSQNLVRVCWKGCFRRWNDHHRILSPSRLGSNVKKLSPIQNLHIGYHTPFTFPVKNYFPLHQRPLTSPLTTSASTIQVVEHVHSFGYMPCFKSGSILFSTPGY